jgi:hypothetical protein
VVLFPIFGTGHLTGETRSSLFVLAISIHFPTTEDKEEVDLTGWKSDVEEAQEESTTESRGQKKGKGTKDLSAKD